MRPADEQADTRALRAQLTNLRALLVLSILMTESSDQEQILRLAASSASSFGSWRIAGCVIGDSWWTGTDGGLDLSAHLRSRLLTLPDSGGPVPILDRGWSWAYPLRSIAGPLGYMVVYACQEPPLDEQFRAQVVAQQTGVAISNARLHDNQRATAAELARTNATLEETVDTLQRGMQIHQRFTHVAASGEGSAGIAEALHDLTGLPVAIEDKYGNLRAWAGPARPDPYPRVSAYDRHGLLRRLMVDGRSVRHANRVVALASPRPDILGFAALIDPDGRASSTDVMALEYAATVLAVELARLRGLVDTESRVRRELVLDLLTGIDDESAHLRAEALGYDLGQPHRVVIVECADRSRPEDEVVQAVRRALRQRQGSGLLGTRSGTIALVTGEEGDWEALRAAVVEELDGGRCRLAVGDVYPHPSSLPRSLREARLALRLQKASSPTERTSVFRDLDVFRMLASVDDLGDIERYAVKWLGPLIEYDRTKKTELVNTLTQLFRHGGAYDATSRALSVHRSTLKYRLQRIRELTRLDLTDPETHFNLSLATRAWLTLRALRGDEPPTGGTSCLPEGPAGTLGC